MALPRPAAPRALWADLRAFFAERSRHQVIAAFLAVLMPIIIVVGFYIDGRTNTAPGEQIVYVESWSVKRSDAEIIAQQKIDQELRKKAIAERQRQYQELERRLGME